ncbi:hypothetical protein [Actinacidiphila sp. bgisy167]|uniref:hypothetical protein n=1 Tax=Actinacidiphila sp. bgisy167 TaxID=3413797 RepID=UPI003D74AD68
MRRVDQAQEFNECWAIGGEQEAGLLISGLLSNDVVQEHVPPDALSRVSSFDALLSYVAVPIGQLGVGPLADRSGGYPVTTAAGVVYAAAALATMASAAVRRLPHGRSAAERADRALAAA